MGKTKLVRTSVVIVGGGFSGTVLALQLSRLAPNLSIAVIDKNAIPTRGLAYGTEHDCHLLNVPAGDMSAFPNEPDHFLKWARRNATSQPSTPDGDSPVHAASFLPRSLYGRYLGSLLHEAKTEPNATGNPRVEWICDEVTGLTRDEDGVAIQRKSGPPLLAQTVVLALGNFPPGNLGIPGLTTNSRRYVQPAWSKAALTGISENDNRFDDNDVLLVGSGLTSVDMAIALHAKGFQGKIHLLSRHGLIPHCHKRTSTWPRFWNERSPRTTRGLLRLVRDQGDAASAAGSDWRAVMDSLRPLIQKIWQSLPIREQRRFLRHLKSYWEVHRHRIAPEIGGLFSSMIASGQVQIHAGRITSYSENADDAEVTFRDRSTGITQSLRVARAVNCSGPQTDCRKIDSPLLASLTEQGLAKPDALALGLDVDANGALLDANNSPSRSLYALGTLRKGRLWETTAVPDLRIQAAELANHLCNEIQRREAGARIEEKPVSNSDSDAKNGDAPVLALSFSGPAVLI